MRVWRLLKLETNDAFTNMAVDEAILKARMESRVPNTLRFYRWKPSAVSIGRFQEASNEVDLESCERYGVDVVRRITGGGSVYHDCDGEVTYSVVVKERDLGISGVVSAYKRICKGIIEAVRVLGVDADFNPGDPKQCPNITVRGRKFSGSAQSRRGSYLLQHGTFLIDVGLEKMFTFLKVPWAASPSDAICVAEKRMTSVQHELGATVSLEDAYQALMKGFQKALDIELLEEELTSYEKKLARKLRREKYATDEWNFGSSRLNLGDSVT